MPGHGHAGDRDHASPPGRHQGALATAHAIWLARQGQTPGQIRADIAATYGYDFSRSVDAIRAVHQYDETAQGCVPEALTSALEAADFEDALRNAVSLGDDADTLAAIAGGLAEILFGVPEHIGVQAWRRVPAPLRQVIEEFYSRSDNLRN